MPANILIVEDEWLIAEDYADTLRDAGHGVVGPYPSVRAAISAVEAERIDGAILDINLGGEQSFALAQRLQEREIPFLFLSGYSDREVPPDMRERKVLSKPVAQDMLLSAIEQMCPRG